MHTQRGPCKKRTDHTTAAERGGEGVALVEETLFGKRDKVAMAIARLKLHEPKEGYYVAFSGGKDSCVVYDLVKRAGVKYDAHYNLTTVDPPELVYFIRDNYPDVVKELPKKTMWQMIVDHGILPTPFVRFCCKELKERGGDGRTVVTGIRHAESPRRAKRKMEETCRVHNGKQFLHPIIEWSDEDVWEYIRKYNVPYCSLYDEGFERIGCVMCPMQNLRFMQRDAKRWPKIAAAYKKAIQKGFTERTAKAVRGECKPYKSNFADGAECFEWWARQGYRECKQKENEKLIPLFGLMADESVL